MSHASPARARSDARRSRRLTSSPKTKKSSPSDATCRSAPTSRARTSSARRVSCRSKPAAAAMSAALTRPPALRSTAASRGFGGSSDRRSSSDIAGRAARRSSTACTGARLGRGRRARVGIATVRSIMAATRGVPPWRLDRPRKIRTALPCRLHSPARGRRACGCLACQRQQLRPRHRRVGVFLFPCWCPISSNKCPSLTVLHLPTTYLPTYPCGASGASPVPRRGSFVVKAFSPWPCCAPSIHASSVKSISITSSGARPRSAHRGAAVPRRAGTERAAADGCLHSTYTLLSLESTLSQALSPDIWVISATLGRVRGQRPAPLRFTALIVRGGLAPRSPRARAGWSPLQSGGSRLGSPCAWL